MFDPWCPTCRSRVLLTARRLRALLPSASGHRALLLCWCGTEVVMDVARLGGGSTAAAPAAPAAPSDAAA